MRTILVYIWFKQRWACLPLHLPASGTGVGPGRDLIFNFLKFCEYHFFIEMAAARTGKDLLEPRMLALLATHQVSPNTMDLLGNNGITTLTVFTCLALNQEKFREIWEKPPFDLKSDNLAGVVEQAKIISAYEAAKVSHQVTTEQEARRILNNLPPGGKQR